MGCSRYSPSDWADFLVAQDSDPTLRNMARQLLSGRLLTGVLMSLKRQSFEHDKASVGELLRIERDSEGERRNEAEASL